MPFRVGPEPTGNEIATERPSFRLSRRDFLAGMALVSTGLAVGCSHRAGSRGNADGWYAWLSDTHIGADLTTIRHAQTMAENLRSVVDEILEADDPPRGLLINGDLALDDGQAGDYARALEILAPVRALKVPIHVLVGNHDDRPNLRAALKLAPQDDFAEKQVDRVSTSCARWLMLDSMIQTGKTGGELGNGQLRWLADELDAAPQKPAIVFLHHNLNADWAAALHDTTAFLDLLEARSQAKAVVFGHTHVWNVQQRRGLQLINLPSVGYKFLRTQPVGWCLFRPGPDGGEIELRPIGRDRKHRGYQYRELRWRSA